MRSSTVGVLDEAVVAEAANCTVESRLMVRAHPATRTNATSVAQPFDGGPTLVIYRRIVSIARRVLGERVWARAKAVQSWFRQLDRERRYRLLKRLPRRAICAEVGVWKGDFSVSIQRRTKPRMLHLIDPWHFEPDLPDRWHGGVIAKANVTWTGFVTM